MLQSLVDSVYDVSFSPTSSPTTFPYTQQDVIFTCGAATAGVSIVGSTFIILSYISFPRLRSFAFELILMISVSNFLSALSYIITPKVNPLLCEAEAVLMTFSELASIFWVGSIAFTINRIFLCDDGLSLDKTHRMKYHLFCWGISLFMCVLPFTTQSYESKSDTWCWITFRTTSGKIWAFVSYYIPVLVILSYLIHVYYKFWKVLNRISQVDERESLFNTRLVTQTRMAVYPTIFFFTIICACLDRVFEIVFGKRSFCLALLHIITINLGGFANAIVYGLTTSVRLEWVACCCPRFDNQDAPDYYVHFEDEVGGESVNRYTAGSDSTYVRESVYSEDQPPATSYANPYRAFTVSK